MLNVQGRDAAARSGLLDLGERKVEFPAMLWVDGEMAPSESHWEPVLAARPNPAALVVTTARFSDAGPTAVAGQLVLPRTLEAVPAMSEGRVRLAPLGSSVSVFHGAAALFRNPRRFAPAVAAARTEAAYSRLLYAPGLGEPSQLAVLAYAGIDVFDAVPLSLAAAEGRYLTSHGSFAAATLERPECVCPACGGEAPNSFTEAEVRRHNQYAALQELGAVRNAIRNGQLRELVEARVRSHPELTALLRRIDAHGPQVEERSPIVRRSRVFANTKESLRRADVARFRERVRDRYQPRTQAPILLLLPCSHRKPYSRSRTHRAILDTVWESGAGGLVHDVIVTSPLGLVPRELELTYPAAHYDVPVTGDWDADEGAMIRELLSSLLKKRAYGRVVSHLPQHTYRLVADLLPAGHVVTCEGPDATKPHELTRLGAVLRSFAKDLGRGSMRDVLRGRLHGLATYQFGAEAADKLFEGVQVQGKWPTGKVHIGIDQLAMLPTDRGFLSLTIDGGERIARTGKYCVEIEDFPVTGSIFAVGVKGADPDIRVGDEVVVTHGGDVRAVGVAAMTGPEMVEMRRGEAVKVRHHV
ncbi:MAG: DUF5591 domain-containing protein [Euryarchaeota archaeon]|nr:DUF5591 domain-containing protein [Euryarchaeota archaeon]